MIEILAFAFSVVSRDSASPMIRKTGKREKGKIESSIAGSIGANGTDKNLMPTACENEHFTRQYYYRGSNVTKPERHGLRDNGKLNYSTVAEAPVLPLWVSTSR